MKLQISQFVCPTLYLARVNTYGLYSNMDEANLLMEEKQSVALRVVNQSSVEEMFDRAYEYCIELIKEGVKAIGACVDLHPLYGMKALNVLLAVKKALTENTGVPMYLIGHPLQTTQNDAMRALYEEAAPKLDIFGSALFRESGTDENMKNHFDFMFGFAKKHNKMLQFQVDQDNLPTETETISLLDYVDTIGGAKDWTRNIFLVYGTSLAARSIEEQKRYYMRLAQLGISVVVCPSAQLSTKMSGDRNMVPNHNSISNVPLMLEYGVNVALGIGNSGDAHCPITTSMQREAEIMATACRYYDFDKIAKIAYENGKKIFHTH